MLHKKTEEGKGSERLSSPAVSQVFHNAVAKTCSSDSAPSDFSLGRFAHLSAAKLLDDNIRVCSSRSSRRCLP